MLSERGHPDEGIDLYTQGLAIWGQTGMRNHRTEWLSVLAGMHSRAGRPEQGLCLIDEALAFMKESEERYHEAELYRQRGDLRLQQNAAAAPEAEQNYHQAIDAAHRMEAKMCELRATTSLARLWQAQDKHPKAHTALVAIYGWFTEGFDSRDLQQARALSLKLRA